MLKKFSVTNFKNFQEKITFDLSNTRGYQFNNQCIKNDIVDKSIVYGKNASGKTNLILGIFDIIFGLTDNHFPYEKYQPYVNLFTNNSNHIKFEYEFYCNGGVVTYVYEKLNQSTFISEQLIIDNQLIIDRNLKHRTFMIDIEGLDSFDNSLSDNNMSVIKYVYRNTKIKEFNNRIAKIFVEFIQFVEKMLLFYSLHDRKYIGFKTTSSENIFEKIIENQKIKEFEEFLKYFELNYKLEEGNNGRGQPTIFAVFGQNKIEFSEIASSGMMALALFYYWYMNISDVSLLVIDEFDAFYHNKLSEKLVKLLIEAKCQVILTTHNTSIMSNELMRPDCYFRVSDNKITSLANSTSIEIREAHNLEKIYRSGWFDE